MSGAFIHCVGRSTQARLGAVTRLGLLLLLCSSAASAQPFRVSFSAETLSVPGNQAGDTALLRDPLGAGRDYAFGSDTQNNGFFGFLVDGGAGLSVGFGAVRGVDAVPFVESLPLATAGGLVVVSAWTSGNIFFFTTEPDGGIVITTNRPLATPTPGPLVVADFRDAGARLFSNNGGPSLQQWRLVEDGGRIDAHPLAPIPLAFAANAVAASSGLRRVYASIGIGGVVEIDPLALVPTVVPVIDAGVPSQIVGGLAVYPQRDGGALLITSVPASDVFRVYEARPGSAVHLLDFTITAPDGGRQLRGADHLDVWPGLFGGPDRAPHYDAGVLVVCDRLSAFGANYKLIPWRSIATAATPPLPIDLPGFVPPVVVTPPEPLRVPWAVAGDLDGSGPLSFWPGRDALLAGVSGLSARSVVDLRARLALDAGVVVGIDAVTTPARLAAVAPEGLVATASRVGDAGLLSVWSGEADGGLRRLASAPLPLDRAGAVTVASLDDAGTLVFVAGATSALQAFLLEAVDGGALSITARPDLALPAAGTALASAARLLYVAAGREGVLEVDALGGGVRQLIDAGAALDVATGLALYPQRDGGALLLTAVAGRDLFRAYRVLPGPTALLAEFQVTAPDDAGAVVRGGAWLDVSAAPVGPFDGGATFPTGALAIGSASGAVQLVSWAALAQAVVPPLPIDSPPPSAPGGGSGGAGGGFIVPVGGQGGGGGGIVEPPPPGCCSGAPSASVLPVAAFLVWLRRFNRRRPRDD